jgi:hypothetical protein
VYTVEAGHHESRALNSTERVNDPAGPGRCDYFNVI